MSAKRYWGWALAAIPRASGTGTQAHFADGGTFEQIVSSAKR
jgi:hypothetical protein